MIVRILASIPIVALLAVDFALPRLDMFRMGREVAARADVTGAVPQVGEPLPDFTLPDLAGVPVTLSDLQGHRVLLTFERSVDW